MQTHRPANLHSKVECIQNQRRVYWGRPHDYLWLSSTHPSLIREEMMKAFETGADKLWVLNVGDIKPLE